MDTNRKVNKYAPILNSKNPKSITNNEFPFGLFLTDFKQMINISIISVEKPIENANMRELNGSTRLIGINSFPQNR